jgi:ethanolamine permease
VSYLSNSEGAKKAVSKGFYSSKFFANTPIAESLVLFQSSLEGATSKRSGSSSGSVSSGSNSSSQSRLFYIVEMVDDVKIGIWTLWAIGVGSVLGGDFFGWQLVLYGGFFSAVGALLFSGAFYWLYAGVITELAARYRTSGGAFDFVKYAVGKRSASMMAVLGFLKLILANSALALAISSYLEQAGMDQRYEFFYNFAIYAIFTFLDCIGIRQSANAQVLATLFCIVILVFWAGSCLTKFTLKDVKSEGYFHNGAIGFFEGLPFALQFFDGFEEVPLLMSYASDPQSTIPRAVLWSYLSVAAIALMVLISGSGISDAAALLDSETPLMDGIDMIYGDGTRISDAIAVFVVLGLLVNFFAFVLFASQQVQAIAEAGQLPSFLAYRHPKHGAPIRASIFSSCVGLALTTGFSLVFGPDDSQRILITASLTPAVLSYYVLLECIVRVRQVELLIDAEGGGGADKRLRQRDLTRLGHDPGELRFTYGTCGARLAQGMCVLFLCSLMVLVATSKEYFYGIIVVFCIGVVLYGTMHLMTHTAGTHKNAIDDTVKLIRSISGTFSGEPEYSGGSPKRTRSPGAIISESSRLLGSATTAAEDSEHGRELATFD